MQLAFHALLLLLLSTPFLGCPSADDDDATTDDDDATTDDDDATADDDDATADDDDDDATADDDDSTDPPAVVEGWWFHGEIAEPGDTCGYDGSTPTGYQFGATVGGATVGRPILWAPQSSGPAIEIPAWQADCTLMGAVATCLRSIDSPLTAGTLHSEITYTFTFDGDSADAAVDLTQSCSVGTCDDRPPCSTSYGHTMTRWAEPGSDCVTPSYPTPAPDAGVVWSGGAAASTYRAASAFTLNDSTTTVTSDAGGAATWTGSAWSRELPLGAGAVRLQHSDPELLPLNRYFESRSAFTQGVELWEGLALDSMLIQADLHPRATGQGHLLLNGRRVQLNQPNVTASVDSVPEGIGALSGGTLVLGVGTWLYANLCPGTYTLSWDVTEGDCWVAPEPELTSSATIVVAVRPGEMTEVQFHCPWFD